MTNFCKLRMLRNRCMACSLRRNGRWKPEEMVSKFRQVDVLVGQGMAHVDAIWQVSITKQTYYRWRKQYGGMGTNQLKELKKLQK